MACFCLLSMHDSMIKVMWAAVVQAHLCPWAAPCSGCQCCPDRPVHPGWFWLVAQTDDLYWLTCKRTSDNISVKSTSWKVTSHSQYVDPGPWLLPLITSFLQNSGLYVSTHSCIRYWHTQVCLSPHSYYHRFFFHTMMQDDTSGS